MTPDDTEALAEALARHLWHVSMWSGGGWAWGCSCGVHSWGTAAENPDRYVRHATEGAARMSAGAHVARIVADAVTAARSEAEASDDIEPEVVNLRSAVAWWARQWQEARAVLSQCADRLDEFTYDELSTVLDDEVVDRFGERFAPAQRAEGDALRARVEAALPECQVIQVGGTTCRDFVGCMFGDAIWTEDMCCLPCRLRAALTSGADQ